MTREERVGRLREAAAAKSADARARVLRAIVGMRERGQTINFNTVAAEAKVSKGYLYRQIDLRQRIVQHRASPTAIVLPPASQASRANVAEQKLRMATGAIQRLRLELESLREENARLRGDVVSLKRSLRLCHCGVPERAAKSEIVRDAH